MKLLAILFMTLQMHASNTEHQHQDKNDQARKITTTPKLTPITNLRQFYNLTSILILKADITEPQTQQAPFSKEILENLLKTSAMMIKQSVFEITYKQENESKTLREVFLAHFIIDVYFHMLYSSTFFTTILMNQNSTKAPKFTFNYMFVDLHDFIYYFRKFNSLHPTDDFFIFHKVDAAQLFSCNKNIQQHLKVLYYDSLLIFNVNELIAKFSRKQPPQNHYKYYMPENAITFEMVEEFQKLLLFGKISLPKI